MATIYLGQCDKCGTTAVIPTPLAESALKTWQDDGSAFASAPFIALCSIVRETHVDDNNTCFGQLVLIGTFELRPVTRIVDGAAQNARVDDA